jgi:two-component system, cell cycle sensor histidine kinase and response regulator CckA
MSEEATRLITADFTDGHVYRAVIEAASLAIIVVDRGGRITLANPAMLGVFGYTAEEVLGQPVEMLLPSTVRGGHRQLFQGFMQAPGVRRMGAGRDLMGLRKDGSEVPIEVALHPIATEAGLCVLAMVSDITDRKREEEGRARLAAIVESTDNAVIGMSLDRMITSWNPGAEDMFGWSAADAVGRAITLIIPPERRDEEERFFSEIREGRSVKHFDTVRMRHDGSLVPVCLSISPIRDPMGRMVGASKILHDVTEREHAEKARAQLAAIVESSHDAVISADLDGIVQSWNPGAEALFGWSAAEMIGKPGLRIVPEDRLDEHRQILARLREGASIDDLTTMRLRRDGGLVPIAMTVSPLRDSAGRVIGASGIHRDITERQRADEARALLAAIVESSGDAIISTTLDGVVMSWNRGAERMLAWPAAAMVGKSIATIIPADRQEEHRQILDRLQSGGGVEDLATLRLRCDGSAVPVSVTVSPILDGSGKVVGTSRILRDTTERHRAEQALRDVNETLERRVAERTQELAQQLAARRTAEAALAQSQKMEAVGQLTGGIAHDFNNLLTVISGNLHFVAEMGRTNDRLRRLAASMQRAVERGSRLTGQLLAFARRQPLMPEVLRLDELINDFSTLVQRALGEAIQLDIRSDRALWACEIDPSQFEAAALNLAINARDAMPDGGRLTITARNMQHPGGDDLAPGKYIAISIADTGCGMAPEVLEHAIEPFFTTKEVGKGSGLGLSQVYGFVQQSGGALRIDSHPGEGTRITMLFPQTVTERTSVDAASPVATATATATKRQAQVLVVEDDLEVLDLVLDTLTEAGLSVIGAHDGHEALTLLGEHPGVKLMLSDVVMPNGSSGVELGREAQRRWPDLRVLLMSGYPRDELTRYGGASAFPLLSKPFRPGELVDRLDRMLHADSPNTGFSPRAEEG